MDFAKIYRDIDCWTCGFGWPDIAFTAMIALTLWGCIMGRNYSAKNKKKCRCRDCIRKNRRMALRKLLKIVFSRCLVVALILMVPPIARRALMEIQQRTAEKDFHPDKTAGGNGVFMALAKTYKALTTALGWQQLDQDTGHTQDVPEIIIYGFALPAWLPAMVSRLGPLGLYGVVLFVFLPLDVAIWWHEAMRHTGQILTADVELQRLMLRRDKHLDMQRSLVLLSLSFEFNQQHNLKMVIRDSDNQLLRAVYPQLETLKFETIKHPILKFSTKAAALLQAHLSRLRLKPATLERDRQLIVRLSLPLVEGMLARLSEGTQPPYCESESLENTIKLLQVIVQAVEAPKLPLLQLPHVTKQHVIWMIFKRQDLAFNSLQRFASLRSHERRALLRPLKDSQYKNAMAVLGGMPLINVDVTYEVLDDKDWHVVTPGATVTATIKIERRDMRTLFGSLVHVADNEEPGAGDRPSATWCRRSPRGGSLGNASGETQDEEWKRLQSEYKVEPPTLFPSKKSHEVHCPLFPDKKQEYWWLYICARDTHSVITKPLQITNLVRFLMIKLQFVAPLEPGDFTFAVCLRSDSYMGVDHCQELKLKVIEQPVGNPQYPDLMEDTVGEASPKSGAEVELPENAETDVFYDANDGIVGDDHFTPA